MMLFKTIEYRRMGMAVAVFESGEDNRKGRMNGVQELLRAGGAAATMRLRSSSGTRLRCSMHIDLGNFG
jgi:hypothetical protein